MAGSSAERAEGEKEKKDKTHPRLTSREDARLREERGCVDIGFRIAVGNAANEANRCLAA